MKKIVIQDLNNKVDYHFVNESSTPYVIAKLLKEQDIDLGQPEALNQSNLLTWLIKSNLKLIIFSSGEITDTEVEWCKIDYDLLIARVRNLVSKYSVYRNTVIENKVAKFKEVVEVLK